MKPEARKRSDPKRVREILAKSLSLESLNPGEVSTLIEIEEQELWDEVLEAAGRVKDKVYGNRIVLFAPLYLSNRCVNDCLYCGFRKGNRKARRKSLTVEEAVEEASLLSDRGYKRLLLVLSEHPGIAGPDYIARVAEGIYEKTDIRILHVNAAPMSTEEFRILKGSGIGVYQCFQETYHYPTYRRVHPSGPKSDFDWRLGVMDRAIEAGFEDVGMGVLLGLYDWRWDVWALIAHSRRIMNKYGFGPHTVSVPRIQPAEGCVPGLTGYEVSDSDFKRIVAVYRLALPYVGIVVSTREPAALRDELFSAGVSQVSAGSRTSPSGYIGEGDTAQFEIGDTRNLEEVIVKIVSSGLIPSLCTACYREGRSGERFRDLAEKRAIRGFCHENALLTLKEYIEDYASAEVREQLMERVDEECARSRNGLSEKLKLIERGRRDIHV